MKVVFVVSTLLLAQVSAVVEPEQASSQGAVEASNRSAEAARRAAADRGAAEPKESKRDRATEALEAANASFDRAVDKAERALHKVQSFAEGVRHACKNETGAQVAARDIEERVQHEVEAKNLSIAEHAKLLKDKYYSSRREHKKLGRGLEKEAREAARDVLKAGGELKHAAIDAKVAEHEYEHVYMHAEKRSEELSLAAELAGESSEVDAERLFDMVEHSIEKSASLLRQRAKEEAKKDAEEKAAAKKEAKEDAKKDAEEKAAAEKEAKEDAKKDAEEKAAAKKVSEADAEKKTVGERRKIGSNKEAKVGKEVESDSRRNASDQLLELPAAAEVLLAQAARPNWSAVDDAKERYQRSLDAAERAISEAGSFAEDFKHAESNTTRIQTLTEQLKHVAREQAEAKNLSLEKRADALKEAFYSDRRAHLNASRGLMRGARALAGEVMKTGLELKAALRAAGGSEREYERAEERAERDSERVEERAERVLEPVQDDIEDLYEKVGERVEEAVDQLHHEEAKRAKEAKKARETVEAEEEKEAKEAKKAEEAKEANEAKGARAAEAKGAAKSAQSAGGRRPSRASFLALPAGATGGEQTFVALSCAALAAVTALAAKTSGPCARRTVRMDVPALG